MRKDQRQQLEDLSLKAFGNKNAYRRLEKNGLKYKDPETGQVAILKLTEQGLVHYLEKTIKVRNDFNAGLEVLKKEEKRDVGSEGN
jgi:hypothetical protein